MYMGLVCTSLIILMMAKITIIFLFSTIIFTMRKSEIDMNSFLSMDRFNEIIIKLVNEEDANKIILEDWRARIE